MKLENHEINKFSLVKEMFETVEIIRNYDSSIIESLSLKVSDSKNFLLTGEGSSRIFPAKRLIDFSLKNKLYFNLHTEGSLQSIDYDLADFTVIAVSNSGKTAEAVRLLKSLKNKGHNNLFSIIANPDTPLEELAVESILLSSGTEKAVAASKSVMEQALIYDLLFRKISGMPMPDFNKLADKIQEALELGINDEIIENLCNAQNIFVAGRNNGVSEELALKTIEITRKKSFFLEGTYALHGIEEVLTEKDALIIVDPFAEEENKFKSLLMDKIGIPVYAISHEESIFDSIKLPLMEGFNEYIQLAAGWNMLVNIGIKSGVNIDKPLRARKIGNEFVG